MLDFRNRIKSMHLVCEFKLLERWKSSRQIGNPRFGFEQSKHLIRKDISPFRYGEYLILSITSYFSIRKFIYLNATRK